MKITELINKIESIYGKYDNKNLKALVIAFITKKWNETEYETVFAETVKQYSTQYKTQPDVAFFNKLWEEQNSPRDDAEKAWNDLLEMKTARKVLITDITAQEVVKSMGGVDDFVNYRNENNHWCRKDFIERYLMLSGKERQPEILINAIERMYPMQPYRHEDVKIIGDPVKGQLILEKIKKNEVPVERKDEPKQIGQAMKDLLEDV